MEKIFCALPYCNQFWDRNARINASFWERLVLTRGSHQKIFEIGLSLRDHLVFKVRQKGIWVSKILFHSFVMQRLWTGYLCLLVQ